MGEQLGAAETLQIRYSLENNSFFNAIVIFLFQAQELDLEAISHKLQSANIAHTTPFVLQE